MSISNSKRIETLRIIKAGDKMAAMPAHFQAHPFLGVLIFAHEQDLNFKIITPTNQKKRPIFL